MFAQDYMGGTSFVATILNAITKGLLWPVRLGISSLERKIAAASGRDVAG